MTFSPVIIGGGLTGYRLLQSTQDAQMQAFARSPQPARDTEYFQQKIGGVQTVDQLMNDRALLRVALGAFGLDEDIDNTAFVRNVLTSDLNDPGSTANRLSDKRYLALAQTFNFSGNEGANLPGARAADTIRGELSQVASVDALLQSSNLLDRTLEAFGLSQYKAQPVLLERVLTSDLNDADSLANRLGDASFVDLARAFQGGDSHLSASLISRVSQDVAAQLQALQSSDDLMADRRLLESVLSVYGLEDDIDNSQLIQRVLDSNLDDPTSLARSLPDPRYAELSEALGFERLAANQTSIFGFADAFDGKLEGLRSSDDLLDDPRLLQSALDVFGLQTEDRDFLQAVLDSDLTDETSVANSETDLRYRAMAEAFGFGAMLTGTAQEDAQDQLSALVDAAQSRRGPVTDVADFFNDIRLMLAATAFFDIPLGEDEARFTGRVLEAYGTDPDAPLLQLSDTRYEALFNALNFRPESDQRTYPSGFTEAVTERYLERQFEIRVGDIDPDLRIALSFERELGDAVASASSNDAQWFKVMASPQLRTVFETAFSQPSAFATLDLDRQLADFKSRSQSMFGTSELAELLTPDRIEQMRERFLTVATINSTAGSSPLALLANATSSNSPVLNLLL
ncbi:MAG: DUF1217 domain-containing protein [Rhodobacteraceae bacterium]|nr:DUF1217 domain-containing protein [Paracoccaceae bacterium]